ncbi:hypothetical protein QZH41_004122 [Actinostola sp. cb2023]|nr:hypothetical protein QZH41_004122 [Actinostola sp. cb2023]
MSRLKAKSSIFSKTKLQSISTEKPSTKRRAQDNQNNVSKKQRLDENRSKYQLAMIQLSNAVGHQKKRRCWVIDSESESEEKGDSEKEEDSEENEDSDVNEVSEESEGSEQNEGDKERYETDGVDDCEDGEEEGEEEAENLGPYRPTSKPTNVFETLVRGWNMYLGTPDGTDKTPAMIRQMCRHVVTIAKAIDPNVRNMDVFTEKDQVYKLFFKRQIEMRKQEKSKGLRSKTLSCYSTSLERFLAYAIKNMRQSLSSEKREALEELKDTQRNWRESWGKMIAQQRAEHEWEGQKNLPTVEEIHSLQSSSHAKETKRMIMHASKYNLATEDAVVVRNYLIFLINT